MKSKIDNLFKDNSFLVNRICDHEGCKEIGSYRAPSGREQLNLYHWFCLIHIRAYNANWNYYAGMNEAEIEQHRRADITWERPTWPIGRSRFVSAAFVSEENIIDPLYLFSSNSQSSEPEIKSNPDARIFPPLSKENQALMVLQLEGRLTFEHIKSAYRRLVKKYHPDLNKGCKIAEEHLKKINDAYNTLKKAF